MLHLEFVVHLDFFLYFRQRKPGLKSTCLLSFEQEDKISTAMMAETFIQPIYPQREPVN